MEFSSLAALKVVKMTTFSAANDEKFRQNDGIFVSVLSYGSRSSSGTELNSRRRNNARKQNDFVQPTLS